MYDNLKKNRKRRWDLQETYIANGCTSASYQTQAFPALQRFLLPKPTYVVCNAYIYIYTHMVRRVSSSMWNLLCKVSVQHLRFHHWMLRVSAVIHGLFVCFWLLYGVCALFFLSWPWLLRWCCHDVFMVAFRVFRFQLWIRVRLPFACFLADCVHVFGAGHPHCRGCSH